MAASTAALLVDVSVLLMPSSSYAAATQPSTPTASPSTTLVRSCSPAFVTHNPARLHRHKHKNW
ncbi:hypothetical protein BS78_08G155800 [Paspalum vaginatum]|nr:hypothetical protein BS78_08G155800 [Paspalum vaginatum]